jgi:hypothetical protein
LEVFYRRSIEIKPVNVLMYPHEVMKLVSDVVGDGFGIDGLTAYFTRLPDGELERRYKVYLSVNIRHYTDDYEYFSRRYPVGEQKPEEAADQSAATDLDLVAFFAPPPTPLPTDEDLDSLFAPLPKPSPVTDLDAELAAIHIEHMTDEAIAALFTDPEPEQPVIENDIILPQPSMPGLPTFEELAHEFEQEQDKHGDEPQIISAPMPDEDSDNLDKLFEPIANALGFDVVHREDTITVYHGVSAADFIATARGRQVQR